MKKQIMSILDKKTNRLNRLSDYRRTKTLTDDGNQFEIEVSSEALVKLNKMKLICFSLEHDFGNKDKSKEAYWLRVNSEYPNKKTDFTYLVTGHIKPSQHFGGNDWGISLKINHIDVATTWGLLLGMTELIAQWVDKKYGKDYGFKSKIKIEKLDFINNK